MGQAGVQACVGAASSGNDVGGSKVDLRVITEPHIVTRRIGCSKAAQGHLFPLTGPEPVLSESQGLHSDHRLVWTIWRTRKVCYISLSFVLLFAHVVVADCLHVVHTG